MEEGCRLTVPVNNMKQFFIKVSGSQSLLHFAELLALITQSSPWEERDSVNYPEGHYFRQHFGPVEIVAQIADDSAYPDADFLVWERHGSSGQINTLVEALAQRGYTCLQDK
jgi:hypothetical protein